MGMCSSFISLRRLLIGAALVIFGFLLASSTTASADDLGLTKTLDKLVTTATKAPAILDPVTASTPVVQEPVKKVVAAVKPTETVTAIVRPVETAVDVPLKAVDPVLAQPVKDVVKTTTSTVTKATTAVTTTTSAVSRTVDPLLRVSKDVVDPVLAVVDTIVPVVDTIDPVVDAIVPVVVPPSLTDLPDVLEPAQALLPAEVSPSTGQASDAVASLVERAHTQRAIRAQQALAPTVADRSSVVAPWVALDAVTAPAHSTARTATSHLPIHQPAVPGPQHRPAPALPAGGAGSGSGAHGSSAPVSGDLAITPTALALPDTSSAAMRSSTLHPRPGPVADPGSRPD